MREAQAKREAKSTPGETMTAMGVAAGDGAALLGAGEGAKAAASGAALSSAVGDEVDAFAKLPLGAAGAASKAALGAVGALVFTAPNKDSPQFQKRDRVENVRLGVVSDVNDAPGAA